MPNPIAGKNILLGVCGSIAAYKAADLASKLAQAGAAVDVILTQSGQKFISPLTFQSLTSRHVYTDDDLWNGEGHINHIGLATRGDLLVIAPASANTIARLAHGVADNLLTLTALAARCPVLIAPAMDGGMYSNPATQANLEVLAGRGMHIIGPAQGRMASGLVGPGRMVEPAELLGRIRALLGRTGKLAGCKVLVTAGGTQEPIDPVRMITNRSSGKQGYAVAQAALDEGADVILIHAPTHLVVPCGAKDILAASAEEMRRAVLEQSEHVDVVIMTAAVADYRPADYAEQKIKKASSAIDLLLEPTADILKGLAARRKASGWPRILVGFAAESQDVEENARQKLKLKDLDLIAANDISSPDTGFAVDENQVTLYYPDGSKTEFPRQSKAEVADELIQAIVKLLARRND